MRPLLAALCLLLAHLAYAEAGHECGHIHPERVGFTSTTSSRTKRQATAREPIRIVPVYYEEDFNRLTSEQSAKYKSVIEQAIDYLSSFLKVERLTQNITLQRFCNSSIAFGALNPYDHCTPDGPCQNTYCALPEFPIPEDHLKACKTCESANSTNCSTDGQDGAGVPDADFVIYVAARDFNCGGSKLAYAVYCFQDRSTDRPIAGVVNLCPYLAEEEDIGNIVLTVTHELTHALVFTSRLMPYYRDENGNPRTPRDESGFPSLLGANPIFLFQPSNSTILQETVKREAINGVYNISTIKVVTPAVLREARKHFDCPTLNGLELENLGPPGTAFTHWKKKLIENEGMTGVISTNGVFSRLTFALYEDSGWYDVDYSVASPLRFGQCLGCDFAEKSCFSYGLDKEPFCKKQELAPYLNLGGRDGGANSSCTYDRLAVSVCTLTDVSLPPFNQSIPIQYQYYSDPNLGGLVETIDYCPTQYGRSHCQRPRDLGENVFIESVGPNSKCVDFEIRTNWEFNSTTISPIYGGACYEISCAPEGNVSIKVGQTEILCQSAGQEVIVPAMGFDIVVICPAFEDICWENSTTCPATTTALPSTPSSTLSFSPPLSTPSATSFIPSSSPLSTPSSTSSIPSSTASSSPISPSSSILSSSRPSHSTPPSSSAPPSTPSSTPSSSTPSSSTPSSSPPFSSAPLYNPFSTPFSTPPSGSAPPSGLSTGWAIVIGISCGLLGLVAVAVIVVVVVVMMCKCRGGGKSSFGDKGRSAITLESYNPIGANFADSLTMDDSA